MAVGFEAWPPSWASREKRIHCTAPPFQVHRLQSRALILQHSGAANQSSEQLLVLGSCNHFVR
jgi:hypothetical protein